MIISTPSMDRGADRLASIMNACPALAAELADAYAPVAEVQEQCHRLDRAAAAIGTAEGDGETVIRRALATGEPLPDLLNAFEAERTWNERHAFAQQRLTAIRAALQSEADQRAHRAWRAVPGALHKIVTAIVTEARKQYSELGGAMTPADAIATGKASEWRRWEEIVTSYAQARDAQARLVTVSPVARDFDLTPHHADWEWAALVRDAEDIAPNLTRRAAPGSAPWLGLPWLAQHTNATPWVPSASDLRDRARQLNSVRAALSMADGNRKHLTDEQRAYLARIGR